MADRRPLVVVAGQVQELPAADTTPLSVVGGLGTGVATFLATPSSANLAAALTDETGSGVVVFDTAPSISNATILAATGTALTVTNTGTGDCLIIKDASGDASPFVIDAGGNVGIGVAAPAFRFDTLANNTSLGGNGFQITNIVNNLNSAAFRMRKARGTFPTPTIASISDRLGTFHFDGYDGSAYVEGAAVYVEVDAGVSAGVVPGRFKFFTADTSGVLTQAMIIDSAQNITAGSAIRSSGATSGIGYTTGAGGTVTQATSKATGVTLNKVTGEITMNNAALAAGAIVSFVLTDSAIGATDYLDVQHVSAGTLGAYHVQATCAAGSATIYVRNNTAGSLSEAIVLKFYLNKAVNA